ncbi:MAG: redoxin domain-containing protein [Melioribacteraceae bacterium]
MKKLILFYLMISAFSFTFPQNSVAQENDKVVIPKVGDRAPDFSLQYFDGKLFTLSEIAKNKPVLLWFTNLCSSCQSKLPFIEELNKKFQNKEMEVLAVSQLGNDRKTVEDVIRTNNLSVRFLYDPSGEATTLYTGGYNPGTCPLTNIYLISKAGKITFATHYPGTSEKELTKQINKLMEGKQQ